MLAAKNLALMDEPVLIVVVLDACTDGTARVAQRAGALTVAINARNVGAARAHGASLGVALGARWLAFTDADTVVAPGWITTQLDLKTDAVCGTVAVHDWSAYSEPIRRQHEATYTDADGHRHIHGANLGVSARAYVRAGGFQSLESSEDVALVEALQTSGASIAWSALPRVVTSARRAFRAPRGFGEALQRVDREMQSTASASP